ncbi:uncharacterized protein LOC131851945 [Achroia grisella]|uniref:uncharacterized protein LOC131851945 n=1 Tax=Achroia grisella TaxID=688607 RepID=UPI0027D33BDC|nr:uncharacterized protein LOC131851945 [Achroia grisella]
MEAQSNEENTAAVTSPVAATPTVAATTSPAAATTSTTTTYTSSEPTATTETSAETTTTIPRAPRTTASKKKKELAKAREELLRKEVELAAARVAALEADTDDEEEDENEEDAATLRRERTTDWIRRTSTLALTMEPHTERTTADLHLGINISSIPAGEGTKAPQPQPCSDAFRRDHASHNGPREDSIAPMMPTKKEEDSLKGGIDYKELATAMTMAARAIQPSTVPRVTELPPFNGASSEWLPWKMAYEESAGQLTEQENLGRLRRCLKGAAKEAAHCLFVGDTSAAEVIQLLATRFGRPGALVMAEMNKLRALPRLSDNPKDICLFASRIANVTATIQALKKNHYLYNEEVTRSITEKMPSALRFKYYDFVAEQPADQPDLITLSKFLQITAARCGDFAPAEIIVNEDRREPATKRSVKTYITQEKPTSPPCPTCNREGHAPPDCITVKNAEPQARWEIAKKHRLCFRCLRIKRFRHNCKTKRCNVGGCTHLHHPLLHVDTIEKKDSEPSDDKAAAVVASAREDKKIAFLKIVPIQVIGPKGTCDTYALLDDGATCTIIEEATAKQIGATGPPAPFYIEAVAGTRINADESKLVHFTIRGRRSEDHAVSARTMKKLLLSPQTVSRNAIEDCPHLYDIIDQLTYEEGQPTVLLGQDNWHLLLAHEVRRGNKTQPVASLTDLGWVLHGTGAARARQQVHRISHLVDGQENEESIERLMKEHFALESLGVTPKRSYNEEEQRALKILQEKTRPLPAGGYETALLWKRDNATPPANYDSAMRRLELIEKKLDKNEDMKNRYKQQITTLLERGYAEIAPPVKTERVWYLPHFAVINPQKPDKLRIVHDAAAKTRGISLNDMLLSGPDLLQSLPGVLMRFRQRRVAVTADIKDMFMRVTIREEDRDMQRFLWRGDRRQGPAVEYRMKSVIFGATSSPCTAIYVKNKNAELHKEEFPEAAAAVVVNHYVDDYLASFDTEEQAVRVSSEVAYIHSRANYYLQRWASNSRHVREEFSHRNEENMVQLDAEKILGMVWRPEEDSLGFNFNGNKLPLHIIRGERTPTKREALRAVMSLFDPLGLATPVTIQAKKILQETWRTGIGWDTELQEREAAAWRSWISHAQQLPHLVIPRCYPGVATAHTTELHTFVDASSDAYACVVYWRAVCVTGEVRVSLIAAKGRVAPLNKVTTIPRLELQAAVLGSRLSRTAVEEHDLKPARRVYWSDSRTVLSWLRTGPRAFKPFVAHRVAEIMEDTKTNEWRWVPTADNVADDATRDVPHHFTSTHRWFRGPQFLYRPEGEWPHEDDSHHTENTSEERAHTIQDATRLSRALPDPARFSDWMKIVRSTARVLQFIDKLRPLKQHCAVATHKRNKKHEDDPTWRSNKIRKPGPSKRKNVRAPVCYIPIDTHYLERARRLWIRSIQEEAFSIDIAALRRNKQLSSSSRLIQLSIFIDEDNVLRLRSRVSAAADLSAEQREPPIVDGQHVWVRLYIAWVHRKLHHGGFETTANEVRQHMWVLRLRHAVRSELKRCQTCRIRKAAPAQPSTGNHPRSRLAHHQRPFTFTVLDSFGPMTVTVGRTHQKRYGVLFTCLTTRAVHLEIAGSLSTDSAVMALRRFISRRGCPTELWSDQGTNLKGADLEMKKAAAEAMEEESSVRFIRWRYIPPSAPFMGGAWERLVRSVKTALAATLHERAPKEEVLLTLLVEVEHTLNSRPLTHVSTSADDEDALTPNHFLLGGPSRVPLPGAFAEGDTAGRKEWRASQWLADCFWRRWVTEYLPQLQHRREPRATHGVIKLEDLVLVADGNLPRNSWPRGVVVATYPGPDGEIRAVDVRTNKGILRRPTKKLVILPIEQRELELNTA